MFVHVEVFFFSFFIRLVLFPPPPQNMLPFVSLRMQLNLDFCLLPACPPTFRRSSLCFPSSFRALSTLYSYAKGSLETPEAPSFRRFSRKRLKSVKVPFSSVSRPCSPFDMTVSAPVPVLTQFMDAANFFAAFQYCRAFVGTPLEIWASEKEETEHSQLSVSPFQV